MVEWGVYWSRAARDDLDGIVEFIPARGDVDDALSVFEHIAARVDSLATMPGRGRPVPEVHLAIEPPLLELIETPWRIMYACEGRRVVIAAIVDGRRNVGALLKSRVALGLPDLC